MSIFDDLNYDSFRSLAKDATLSKYEKIGFPDTYRTGFEEKILQDVSTKLPALFLPESVVLDIGCGCSDLPQFLMERATELKQELILVDSEEMLSLLPAVSNEKIVKIAAKYPNCEELLLDLHGRVNAILVYSVIQYVFSEGNIFDFLDKSLALLAPNGRMLIGDIPNNSMRKRFFSSETGIRHHQEFTQSKEIPSVTFNSISASQMDDSVVLAILSRARAAGFHAYVLPQDEGLPMANRREDILVIRP
jgi:cyclopropane fatty-acyl-phospholipid synthase-like methyltransferase